MPNIKTCLREEECIVLIHDFQSVLESLPPLVRISLLCLQLWSLRCLSIRDRLERPFDRAGVNSDDIVVSAQVGLELGDVGGSGRPAFSFIFLPFPFG